MTIVNEIVYLIFNKRVPKEGKIFHTFITPFIHVKKIVR